MAKTLLSKIDSLIRASKRDEARAALLQILETKIPRKDVCAVATFLRRAELHGEAVKLLHPIVRNSKRVPIEPTDMEKAEYAASLTFLGASQEALNLLSELDPTLPERDLFEAFAHMSLWNYEKTVPLLNRYVENRSIDPYFKLVGQLNLSAALVYERKSSDASALLESVVDAAVRGQFELIEANARRLQAMNSINQKNWRDAEAFLETSSRHLRDQEGLERLYLRKWSAIVQLFRTPTDEKALTALHEVRSQAVKIRHFETIRSCDRFEATITQNQALYFHVFFGSPFESFRHWMKVDFDAGDLPEFYLWSHGKRIEQTLDLKTAELEPQGNGLKKGQLLHRLVTILASDFYRPMRVATLFENLHPKEFFNPVVSPSRVHQAVRLLRTWIEESGFAIKAEEENSGYWLSLSSKSAIRIYGNRASDTYDLTIEKLRQACGDKPFSIKEACALLELPRRSINRILQKACDAGTLERQGSKWDTRYHIPDRKKNEAA